MRGGGDAEGRARAACVAEAPAATSPAAPTQITPWLPARACRLRLGGNTCRPTTRSHRDALREAAGNPKGRFGKTLSH